MDSFFTADDVEKVERGLDFVRRALATFGGPAGKPDLAAVASCLNRTVSHGSFSDPRKSEREGERGSACESP